MDKNDWNELGKHGKTEKAPTKFKHVKDGVHQLMNL